MKTHRLFFFTLFTGASSLLADYAIIPAEYDNIRETQQSTNQGEITNTSPTFSANTYKIGGQSLNFRCIVIPKIQCRASTPELIPSIVEKELRVGVNKNVVPVYSANYRIENGATDWYLCGAMYGGMTADISELNTTVDATGRTQIAYTYVPNDPSKNSMFWGLTNSSQKGEDSSYMSFRWKQVCR